MATVATGNGLLHEGFLAAAAAYPERSALVVDGWTITYDELRRRACRIAATVQRRSPAEAPPLTAVLASRSVTTFAGILGALIAGRSYVPLNPQFPPARSSQMLTRAGCTSIIVDSGGEDVLIDLLGVAATTLVILPERHDVSELAARFPQHVFVGSMDLETEASLQPVAPEPTAAAYLLFTSGSTGVAKGVAVTHRNVTHFVTQAVERYGITAADRLSQTFDTTFDLSVFDMFVGWWRGACVCCTPLVALWNPGPFINQHQLTIWFSVPTTALFMKRLGALKPGSYPSLRWSLFCGEPLPADLAETWAEAAPNSIVENLYGPTELTIACTVYRWETHRGRVESERDIVPIGQPLPEMEAVVVDEHLVEVGPGEVGELLMAGPQRAPGYWRDPEATLRANVRLAGREPLFYRTGDRVRRPSEFSGPLTFLGRLDQQVKIRGYRVELGEIESSLRRAPGVDSAAVVPWPTSAAGALGVVAFVSGVSVNPHLVRQTLVSDLPDYAVPHQIHVLPALPLNSNKKVDRRALLDLLTQ